MQRYPQIQTLFLQWHKHHGICSIEKIRSACSNLMMSFDLQSEHPLFIVFFPLVRKGFIEFSGDGKYQISQPAMLYYQKEQIAVGINLFAEQKELLAKFGEISEDDFGVVRLKKISKKLIQDFCIKANCDYSEPKISEILSNFPKISAVVETYTRIPISSPGEYYDVLKHQWKRNKNQPSGIFKLSEDSHQYYLRTQKHGDVKIPNSKLNPEGRPLAESYQAAIENHNFLFYNRKEKTLTVKNINIPILIERVLRMASLSSLNGVKEEYKNIIYKNISYSAAKQLNRIFETKVEIES